MCTNMCKTKYIYVSSFGSFICKINQRVLIDIRQTIVNIVETDRIILKYIMSDRLRMTISKHLEVCKKCI